jgi:hypothetical protein
MAGRGTDIQLGGNVEMKVIEELEAAEAREEEVDPVAIRARVEAEAAEGKTRAIAAGGLYVLATERHESRRIYAVIFVEPNDVLNVRAGPGVNFGTVGELPPDANDVRLSGSGQLVSGSTWMPIQRGGVTGWVNSRFLTQFVPEDAFCGDRAVLQLLDRLETAVANQDDSLFAQLIHTERGLRVRLLWHQTETLLDSQGLFSDSASYNWGAAAGSGEAITGTPAEVLLPRLQTDLLDAAETACNELLHGGSAGFVVLPDAYAPINYYSFYRPGTEEFAGLNWGSWVVGLELWQGQYYLSTLVHYQWEP